MATKLTASNFKVTITEQINLSGKDQGSINVVNIPNIATISKRILNITTNEAVIATFSGAVASAGHYNDAAVRYMRFTNKDDTYFITLTFRNQDNDEVAIKLDAGQSFIWCGDNANGMSAVFNATEDADAASDSNFGSLTNIQADAEASTVDMEMLIASI